MLRLLTYAASFLIKGSAKRPVRFLIGRSVIYVSLLFSGLFLLAGLFIYLAKTYSAELACLGLAALFVLIAIGVKLWLWLRKPSEEKTDLPPEIENDSLAAYIPDSVMRDPVVQRLLKEIGENPIAATATAVTLGMILSREIFKD